MSENRDRSINLGHTRRKYTEKEREREREREKPAAKGRGYLSKPNHKKFDSRSYGRSVKPDRKQLLENLSSADGSTGSSPEKEHHIYISGTLSWPLRRPAFRFHQPSQWGRYRWRGQGYFTEFPRTRRWHFTPGGSGALFP